MRTSLQPAFILHRRPFRDTSLLLDCLTQTQGRISLVARNARGSRSRFKGTLEPFVPFLLSWSGKTELCQLSQAEAQGAPYFLAGDALITGFYLNELMLRLLPRDDPHPDLYQAYQQTVAALATGEGVELVLRLFEKQLLTELGYGIDLQRDQQGDAIQADQWYLFSVEKGFYATTYQENHPTLFLGEHLLALQWGKLQQPVQLQAAKRLMRLLLAPLLGSKPLKSRELWR